MTSERDVEKVPSALGEPELIALIAGGTERTAVIAAVKELARRKSENAAPVLAAVMLASAAPAEARAAAAVALGKEARPEHEHALELGLKTDDGNVVRRAAEALGRIGGREALAALQAVPPPPEPAARRALAFARSLVSYRLGLGVELLRPSEALAVAAPAETRATSLKWGPVGKELLGRVAAGLRRELPAISVAPEGGVELDCVGDRFVLLPTADAAKAAQSNFLPAIVLKRSHSLAYFSVHLYLLSHSLGEGLFALFGVRPDGTLTHEGALRSADGAFDFELVALDTPYSPPFAIEGRLLPEEPRIEVRAARVEAGPRARAQARVPRKLG